MVKLNIVTITPMQCYVHFSFFSSYSLWFGLFKCFCRERRVKTGIRENIPYQKAPTFRINSIIQIITMHTVSQYKRIFRISFRIKYAFNDIFSFCRMVIEPESKGTCCYGVIVQSPWKAFPIVTQPKTKDYFLIQFGHKLCYSPVIRF